MGIYYYNTCEYYFDAFQELEEFSFQYMLYHLTAVVQSESFQELDGETIKNLMIVLADNGAFKY